MSLFAAALVIGFDFSSGVSFDTSPFPCQETGFSKKIWCDQNGWEPNE
jgi:hypothetical protein